tara:strand:- start:6 stop:1448 length:1443 start_codon:yes stop_codon:yes gene_type:complete
MPEYNAPIKDFKFVLNDFLNIEEHAQTIGLDMSLMDPLLEEGGRFCKEVLFPLNQTGDQQGLKYENGNVILPDGFVEAYQQFVQMGWPSFACDTKYGGQGLPESIYMAITEMICSTNLSFGLTPGLTHGAYTAMHGFASDELNQKFLPKMVSGEWTGVMCLTEPQAGTDLGLVRTTATPNDDGSYSITGNKIFISAGEQNATENIIHLILARLPGAPEGPKGISLLVAPKMHINDDGSLGEANGISCGAIEHKMGLHASPTCVMNYENAKGWLVGEEHDGLRAMFAMMNEERIYVGIQGLGIAEVAYQNAHLYAKERLQGRALNGAVNPDGPADPITVHPDVRKMLLTMRTFTEGARAFALWTGLELDLSKSHPDEKRRKEAEDFVALVTPIVKAYFTDLGFEVANLGMQVHGGYGYIAEYGMEQYARDARITQIYEGTNGIQALDLVGRKLPQDFGKLMRGIMYPITEFLEEHRDNEAA